MEEFGAILVGAIYSFLSVSILKVVYFYHAECMNTVQKNPNRNSCFACQINYILASNYLKAIVIQWKNQQVMNCPQLQLSAKTRHGNC
ncbi:hypothetical protein T05_3369 [Trichinella murrelli]|uniref:Uncharacterized protein n=1 Tax=Trichinella murrelli TaxID=144512 RepID=A0A0V0T9C6_9BILA|nr:hypothetical protein T05_3369 [Trichinella murrelli]